MKKVHNLIYDKAFDAFDFLKYDVVGAIVPIKIDMPDVPNKINITIHPQPNIIWIESQEYPGLFASGSTNMELWESLNDAIYSYFGVPRYIANKLGNKFDLPLPDGSLIVERPNENLART